MALIQHVHSYNRAYIDLMHLSNSDFTFRLIKQNLLLSNSSSFPWMPLNQLVQRSEGKGKICISKKEKTPHETTSHVDRIPSNRLWIFRSPPHTPSPSVTQKTDRRPTEISCLFESCCTNGKALINWGICLRRDAILNRRKAAALDDGTCSFSGLTDEFAWHLAPQCQDNQRRGWLRGAQP